MAFLAGSSISMQPRHTLVTTSKVSGLKSASFMKHGKSSLSFTMRRLPMPARLQICCSVIEDRVRRVISEQLGVKKEEIVAASSFVEDLGADDVDMVELVMALEEEFDTEITDEEAEKITTVQAAFDYFQRTDA